MDFSIVLNTVLTLASSAKSMLWDMAFPLVGLFIVKFAMSYAMSLWHKRQDAAPISEREISKALKRMKNPTEKERSRQKAQERRRAVNREARRRMMKEEADRIRDERQRRAGGHVVDPSYAAWYWGTYQGTGRPADQAELDQVEAWADEDANYNPLDPDAGQLLEDDWFEGLQEPEDR